MPTVIASAYGTIGGFRRPCVRRGIPLGIKANRFEKQLLEKGFTERKLEGNHTGKSYIYDGEVYGATFAKICVSHVLYR